MAELKKKSQKLAEFKKKLNRKIQIIQNKYIAIVDIQTLVGAIFK